MADSQKNQALTRNIEELEEQAAGERQEVATWIKKLKHQPEVKAFEDRKLSDQVLQTVSVNYSYLQHQHDTLLQKYALLLSAFTDVKTVAFEEYISAEADKIVQNQIKVIREETGDKLEALQSKIQEPPAESASDKENGARLSNVISTKLEEIGKLETLVNTLITDAEKSSAKIQELETVIDALDGALEESTQSLSVKDNELSEMQFQYNMEKKRLEDELCGYRKADKMLNERLQNEKEKNVRSSVQPRSNTPGGEPSSAVFTPITCTKSICEYMVDAGPCCYRANALDISKHNVLAVAYDEHSVYLYSEANKTEEKLCTCQYGVICLAWNQQGTLLAIGGEHNNNTNKTIQVWDIPNRKIIKKLKMKNNGQNCFCLDWNEDTITAGTDNYIYQWNINDQDNDQDTQENKALVPRETIQNKHGCSIRTVQWSNCKSKLATITYDGNMYIYDEEFKLIHHNKAHEDGSCPFLQWCPWDNQVIATCCTDRYLKIWKVQQDITLIKKVKHESGMANIKWIPSKKAIITAHWNNQLVLWEYPSLSIILTMNGHTDTPLYLAVSADKSALVSKSDEEVIFWR